MQLCLWIAFTPVGQQRHWPNGAASALSALRPPLVSAGKMQADGDDIREVVHEIEQLNSLPGPVLEIGQEIAVPIR